MLATHSDISLSLLGAGATAEEHAVLSAIPYNNNDIYLHTDEALMPVGASTLFFMHGQCCLPCSSDRGKGVVHASTDPSLQDKELDSMRLHTSSM